MPPIAKKYKVYKTESDKSASEKDSPEKNSKPKVVSGQLEKSIIKKHKKPYKTKRGVVFLKNLPNGFFEEQLQRYFQQFGKITRVRLARSVKSCAPKGFAFIEFAIPEVAEIAAETMNNYLMFKKIVKAAYIPPDEQKFDYFRTSVKKIKTRFGKEKFVSSKTRSINRQKRLLNNWSDENYVKRTQRQERKLLKMKETLSDLDLDIDSIVRRPAEKVEDKSTSSEGPEIATNESKKKQKPAKEESQDSSDTKVKTSDTTGTTSDEKSTVKNNKKLKRKATEISKNKGKESKIVSNESNSSSQDKKLKNHKKKPIANGKSSISDATTTTDEADQSITPPARMRSRNNMQSVSTSIDSSSTTEPTFSASQKSKKGIKKLPKLSTFKDPSGYVVESLFESSFNGDDDTVQDDTFEIESAKLLPPDSTPESTGKNKSKSGKGKIPLKQLLEDTIEDDSSDEDFDLEEELELDGTEHSEEVESEETEDSEEEVESEATEDSEEEVESEQTDDSEEEVEDTKPKSKRNKPDNPLKRLMESTLEDDSSDDEFELEEESSDLSEEEDDDEEEEQDSSPQKFKNKKSNDRIHAKALSDKLDKIARRKLHEGGIQKKQKQKKPQKSQALKQKILEVVKVMPAQKNLVSLNPKGGKVGGLGVKKEKQMKNKKRRL